MSATTMTINWYETNRPNGEALAADATDTLPAFSVGEDEQCGWCWTAWCYDNEGKTIILNESQDWTSCRTAKRAAERWAKRKYGL